MATSRHETRFELTATDKTKAAIKSAQSGFDGLNNVVGKLAAGFGLLAGAGGIGVLISRQVDGARQAVAYADALQVPIDKLTAMQSAGEVVGIGSDKLADILKDTAEKIADAYRNGGGEAVEVLQGLGLSIQHINSLSPDQQLFAIAEALGQVGTQGEKIQILEALASDASLLLPLLDDNAARLKDLMDQADATGKTLTRIEADTLMDAGQAMRELEQAGDALAQTLAVTLAPYLTNLIEFATEIAGKFKTAETAVEGFFNQLFSAKNDEAFTSLSEAQNRLDLLVSRYDALQGRIENAGDADTTMANRRLADLEKEIVLQRERVALAERQQQIMEDYRAGRGMKIEIDDPFTGGDSTEMLSQDAFSKMEQGLAASLQTRRDIIMESYLDEQIMIDEAEMQGLETKIGYDELRMQSHHKMNEAMRKEDEQRAKERERLEANVQSKISGLKGTGLNIAVGMLRQLGQEHDGAAYAAIALEKAIALAQIETSTAAALAAANTLYSLGPAGPAAVATAKADILSSAAFSRGMVIASGLLEASQVGRGGGGAGGGAIPVTPVQSPTNLVPINSISAPEQGNQITIVIKGEGPFDDMVRNSVETLSNNDELVIIRG